MRDPVSDSMSSSGYCELPSSLGQETEGLGPSKLSGSVHRSAKQTRSQRRVTFDGYLRPIMKVQIPGPCTTESVEHVPPEIELPDATTHTQAASEAIENVEPLSDSRSLSAWDLTHTFAGAAPRSPLDTSGYMKTWTRVISYYGLIVSGHPSRGDTSA